ncbi:uncharacterized protein TrAFT101_000981 [Trichoderma asperellum]|uniref:uncharacterized protein n=1 Tax=Trichoderma asperellum TaxID=101201 RepID=UPI00332D8014|nr:hypothetical protein TrAFT101_000981 [Trichoderma asperellum]
MSPPVGSSRHIVGGKTIGSERRHRKRLRDSIQGVTIWFGMLSGTLYFIQSIVMPRQLPYMMSCIVFGAADTPSMALIK